MKPVSAARVCLLSWWTLLQACAGGDATVSDSGTDLARSSAADVGENDAELPASGACAGQRDGAHCGDGGYCRAGRCVDNVCGDGLRVGSEQCDDGNRRAGDGCDAVCQLEMASCGDGLQSEDEECDDGNWIDADECSNACLRNECGNGRVDGNEECDDGNDVDDDECASTCLVYACRNGRLDPGEECDDGNATDRGDGCTNACETTICGNGRVEKYETCDDGNRRDGDGCPASCVYAVCGNGVVEGAAGEVCEGSRVVSTGDGPGRWRGCSDDCTSWLEPARDACARCLAERCANYMGVDLMSACFARVDPALGADPADPANADYVQRCVDVVNCALAHRCGTQADATGFVQPSCYCGSASIDECAVNGPASDAACVNEWRLAARAASNDEVFLRLTDTVYASGVASVLLECIGRAGPDTCGLACDSSYCERTCDPLYCASDCAGGRS